MIADGAAPAWSRGIKFAPLWVWLIFSALTIYCYFGGPYVYRHMDDESLVWYLAGAHVAIIVGYLLAIHCYRPPTKSPTTSEIRGAIRRLATIAVPGVCLALVTNVGSGLTLDAALADPDSSRRTWIESGGSISIYLITIMSAANYPLVGATMANWSALRWKQRWPALLVTAAVIVYSIQGGSRAGIFGIMAVVASAVLAATFARRIRLPLWVVTTVGGCALFAFAVYSSFITTRRTQTDDYSDFLVQQREVPIDPSHYSINFFPKLIEPAVLSGYFYFGHGYEGLAQCMEKPFIGVGFGAAHSSVLLRNLIRATGDEDLIRLSCFDRLQMENGYSESLWITSYAWIANDLTYPGSVLFMVLLAWMLGTAWLDVLNTGAVSASSVLAWLAFGVSAVSVGFPPGDIGSVVSYWAAIAVWLVNRRRPVWRPASVRHGPGSRIDTSPPVSSRQPVPTDARIRQRHLDGR